MIIIKALITGASSGIGKDIAMELSARGYELILVARSEDKLNELKKSVKTKTEIYTYDLSKAENCYALYNSVKNKDVDIIINNAGFGIFEEASKANLDDELKLINVNVVTVHILTKLFLKDFVNKNKGYILNVGSVAGLLAGGPLMASYYASKAYVVRLTEGIYEELRRKKSNVSVSVLCPGPVKTNFNNTAGVKFSTDGLESKKVAKYAIDKMFKKEMLIVPGILPKLGLFSKRFVSDKFLTKLTFEFQKKKM